MKDKLLYDFLLRYLKGSGLNIKYIEVNYFDYYLDYGNYIVNMPKTNAPMFVLGYILGVELRLAQIISTITNANTKLLDKNHIRVTFIDNSYSPDLPYEDLVNFEQIMELIPFL